MKSTTLKFIPLILLTFFLSLSCSTHCDDEDYERDEQEKSAMQQPQDSIKVNF